MVNATNDTHIAIQSEIHMYKAMQVAIDIHKHVAKLLGMCS